MAKPEIKRVRVRPNRPVDQRALLFLSVIYLIKGRIKYYLRN